MEANDSKSSNEETDRSDEMPVTSRSYECVFCKRGFTTAQALGGHMNIHRKDRVKSGPPIVSSAKVDENLISSHSYPYHQPPYSIASEVHVSYQPFFPAYGWGFRPPHTKHNSQHLNPFGLKISSSHENKKTDESSQEDDGLDLELRLGHDP